MRKAPLRLSGCELTIRPFIQEPMVRISGISSQVSVDTLELFFENTKRSGGGDIESIEMVEADEAAVITFTDKTGTIPLMAHLYCRSRTRVDTRIRIPNLITTLH